MSYIDQSTLDECREALRQGRTLEQLAGHLRVESDHLASLLGLTAKPVPVQSQAAEFDLWRSDELNARL